MTPEASRAGSGVGAIAPGSEAALGEGRRGAIPSYSDVIRERWRRPRFRARLDGANAVAEDVNPLCGDRVRLMLRLEDERVQTARFLGDSCAICTAAADVLAEMLEGLRRDEALGVTTQDLLATLAADIRPTRLRCVMLPLTVLAMALGNPA